MFIEEVSALFTGEIQRKSPFNNSDKDNRFRSSTDNYGGVCVSGETTIVTFLPYTLIPQGLGLCSRRGGGDDSYVPRRIPF